MLNFISAFLLFALSAAFFTMAWLAWHSPRTPLRWGSIALAGTAAAASWLLCLLTVLAINKVHAHVAPVPDFRVLGEPEPIRRGRAIASRRCGSCHGLTEGGDLGEQLPVLASSLPAAHLMPAGDLTRCPAVRYSAPCATASMTGAAGSPLANVSRLSDADIPAVIS
jgi:mono/diheme cytochrome c family protein